MFLNSPQLKAVFPLLGLVLSIFHLLLCQYLFTRISVVNISFHCEPESMIICVVITNQEMRCDLSNFKRSMQAKFSTDTGQQNVLGDVTVFQNSQLIAKSKTFLDRNVLCMCANFCCFKAG